MLIPDERQFMKRTGSIFDNQRKRAAKDFQRLGYTLAELRQKARVASNCPYCGVCLTTESLSFDHRKPVAAGGEWTLENLSVTCLRCNQIKSVLCHESMMRFVAFLDTLSLPERESITRRLRAGAVRIFAKGKR